jgi:hypothetical protein
LTDYEAALRRIEEGSINTCPGCGDPHAKWAQPMLVGLPDIGGGTIQDKGIEAFAYGCQRCGYLRIYAVEAKVDQDASR